MNYVVLFDDGKFLYRAANGYRRRHKVDDIAEATVFKGTGPALNSVHQATHDRLVKVGAVVRLLPVESRVVADPEHPEVIADVVAAPYGGSKVMRRVVAKPKRLKR